MEPPKTILEKIKDFILIRIPILTPQTETQFDRLVALVAKTYDLFLTSDLEHSVATLLMHSKQLYITPKTIGDGILKGISMEVAYAKLKRNAQK